MNSLIFNILMALIVAVFGVIARELLPYLRQKRDEVEARIRRTKWAWAADIIDAVVRAVEQTVAEDIHGKAKKQEAVRYIKYLCGKCAIELSDEEIDTLIEAAVNTMNSGFISVETVGSIPDDSEPVAADPAIVAQLKEQLAEADED